MKKVFMKKIVFFLLIVTLFTSCETLMNAGETYYGTATEIYKPKRPKA